MIIYLLGIIQEYLVIINVYNGDLIPFLNENFEYAFIDLIILMFTYLNIHRILFTEYLLINVIFFSHLQWYLHSPFSEWPTWWTALVGDKTENDVRHRTEFYDTHVMCFTIWLILFLRWLKFFKTS
tara:strand:- start:265 stop:642 length:378 start_codon:yes stop_codon:yes gene_type:complete